MELQEYLRILRKRWWILVLLPVLTAASALAFSMLQPREYESTVEVIIEPARADMGLTQSTKTLMRSYMTVADSNQWAQNVIDELQLSMRAEELRSHVRFAAQDDRMVIQIQVEDYDGEQANRIARTWAQELVEWRDSRNQVQRKEDRVYAILRDEPTYAQSWPPSRKIILAAGAFLGLVLASAVVFFLEWLEAGVIRSRQDVERLLGLTVMGSVPAPTHVKRGP